MPSQEGVGILAKLGIQMYNYRILAQHVVVRKATQLTDDQKQFPIQLCSDLIKESI